MRSRSEDREREQILNQVQDDGGKTAVLSQFLELLDERNPLFWCVITG
jgi:hypothetical protein